MEGGEGGGIRILFHLLERTLGTLHGYCCVKMWQSHSPCVDLLREVGLEVHS